MYNFKKIGINKDFIIVMLNYINFFIIDFEDILIVLKYEYEDICLEKSLEVLGYILDSIEKKFVVILEIMFYRKLISKFFDKVYVGRLYVMVLELDS